jgi:hypothetical protein
VQNLKSGQSPAGPLSLAPSQPEPGTDVMRDVLQDLLRLVDEDILQNRSLVLLTPGPSLTVTVVPVTAKCSTIAQANGQDSDSQLEACRSHDGGLLMLAASAAYPT